jgi:hypothetical protein
VNLGQRFQDNIKVYSKELVNENTGSFKIIVGVSVPYNIQTGDNKITLLTEYENATQKVLLFVESVLRILTSFNMRSFRNT